MQSATFQQGNSGIVLVTDKHIIIVTLASEWGFAVHKVCPLILSLQPSPQPWRSWGVIITSMANTQGKYYSRSFILSVRDLVMKAQSRLSNLTKLLELQEAEPDMEPWHLAPRLAPAYWVRVLYSPYSLRRRPSSVTSNGFPETHTHSRAVSTQLLFTDKTMMKQTKSETQGMSALGGYVDTMTLPQLKEWPQVPTRGHQHGPHGGAPG